MAEQSPWIFDTATKSFEADVIERSNDVPVVVDFWAPWCEPCRELGPLLEKLAIEYDGKFLLAKVNIDESKEVAAMIGAQQIPLVVAFCDGRPASDFLGVLAEDKLREWLAAFLPTRSQELVAAGQAVEAEDAAAAEAEYREALELEPNNAAIKAHLARVLLTLHRDDECRQIITDLESRGFLEPEVERVKSQLDLLTAAEEAGGVDEARNRADANPDDLSFQLQLADALAVSLQHEEALEICLQLVLRDKTGIGVEAKETMVKIMDLVGSESELAGTYRRKLATALY